MKTLGYVMGVLIAFSIPVRAAQVYSGCTVPPPTYRHIWFFDPVNGKTAAAGGKGSQAAPWNSMQAVTGTKTGGIFGPAPGYTGPLLSSVKEGKGGGTGPIQPGDMLMLMSGNYGDIAISDYMFEVANSDFVVVEAAPGQTPVFDTLAIARTNKWLFNGIKIQSVNGTNGNRSALVTVGDQGGSYPTADIVFENMDISTADHTVTSTWTQAQWNSSSGSSVGRFGMYIVGSAGTGTDGEPYTSCVSVTNSHIHDVTFAAALFANRLLFSNNEVDHFGDDGIDYGATNMAITRNYIHDNFDIGDGNHEDAAQGQIGPLASGVAYNRFSNILIDSNLIIRQTDPNLAFPTYLQGIDAFDEDWTNVTVTNNVIVTSSCWGIYFGSIHNSLIAGNTVADDLRVSTPGCTALISAGGKTHESPNSSSNVRITSNLGDRFGVGSQGDVNVTFDNNVATNSYEPFGYWNATTNSTVFQVPASWNGTNGNVIFPKALDLTTVFATWSPSTLTYNLMLKAGAKAIGAGSGAGPPIDILGYTRRAPYTAGAYSYPW